MSLIKKLGIDFFNEKFSKGMYVLNGSLYLVLGTVVVRKEGDQEAQQKLTNLVLKKRDAQASQLLARATLERTRRWDEDTIDRALFSEEWLNEQDDFEDIEDFMEQRGHFQESPEYVEAYRKFTESTEKLHLLTEELEILESTLSDGDTCAVRSIDFANKKIVDVPEELFQSIKMFWDFPEGYRVLRTWKNVGQSLWVGPSLNGARCIKLDRRGYATTRPNKAETVDDATMALYGFYLEEDRWKDILYPQPVSLEEALQNLREYEELNKHHENSVLLEGTGAIISGCGVPNQLYMYFRDRVVAVLDNKGNYKKIKKGLMAIAVKQGAICQPK